MFLFLVSSVAIQFKVKIEDDIGFRKGRGMNENEQSGH